ATGYLEKVHFKEGAEVKQGDLLFEIDPRPYQAQLDQAEAKVALTEATVKRLEADEQRATKLLATGAVMRAEFAKIAAERHEAVAAVAAAKAAREVAKLNLDFTKVRAPVGGRIGRSLIDPGNLVKADDTALATLVRLDPIYAYFDMDERTALRLLRLA